MEIKGWPLDLWFYRKWKPYKDVTLSFDGTDMSKVVIHFYPIDWSALQNCEGISHIPIDPSETDNDKAFDIVLE